MKYKLEFNEREEKVYPYVVEVLDYQDYNEYTGEGAGPERGNFIVSHEVLRFFSPYEAIDYFFNDTKRRDFCFGENFTETEDAVYCDELDEGGTTYFVLHKWPDFEKYREVEYSIEYEGVKETVHSYNELISRVKEIWGENAYVHWDDNTVGHVGWPYDKKTKECFKGCVLNNTKYLTDPERERKHEEVESRRVREFKEDSSEPQCKRACEDAELKCADDEEVLPF